MHKADNVPPYSAVVKKSRSLNFLDPSGHAWPVTGVLYLYLFCVLCAQIVLGVCRLGVLSVLLSDTLVSGFTTGAAVHVLTSQIKNLLGVKVQRHSGPLKIVYVSFVCGSTFQCFIC